MIPVSSFLKLLCFIFVYLFQVVKSLFLWPFTLVRLSAILLEALEVLSSLPLSVVPSSSPLHHAMPPHPPLFTSSCAPLTPPHLHLPPFCLSPRLVYTVRTFNLMWPRVFFDLTSPFLSTLAPVISVSLSLTLSLSHCLSLYLSLYPCIVCLCLSHS